MAVERLDLENTRLMFHYVSIQMIAAQDRLTQADRAIGDGDHGVGMARGFEAVAAKLEQGEFASLGELFKAIGMALITSVGGAAGVVFGTLFRDGARRLEGRQFLDPEALAWFLQDGLASIQARGQAKPGDKTMLDVLAPVAARAADLISQPLDEALRALVPVAEKGLEDTRSMIARVGKAKTLGERSLGYPDPGGMSMLFILQFMVKYME
jgi:phosphoenolpyruvate---glycerone phosphotransferase subunit DhaL